MLKVPKASSDPIFVDEKGNRGYELKGIVIATRDLGSTVEIRPNRTKSAIVEIENFDGDFKGRPHSSWRIGDEVVVRIFKL